MIFSDLVEVVKSLSTDEKREIQLLLQQYLREERRDAIDANSKLAYVQQQRGGLTFSSNIDELKRMIDE